MPNGDKWELPISALSRPQTLSTLLSSSWTLGQADPGAFLATGKTGLPLNNHNHNHNHNPSNTSCQWSTRCVAGIVQTKCLCIKL